MGVIHIPLVNLSEARHASAQPPLLGELKNVLELLTNSNGQSLNTALKRFAPCRAATASCSPRVCKFKGAMPGQDIDQHFCLIQIRHRCRLTFALSRTKEL